MKRAVSPFAYQDEQLRHTHDIAERMDEVIVSAITAMVRLHREGPNFAPQGETRTNAEIAEMYLTVPFSSPGHVCWERYMTEITARLSD